MAGEEGSNPAPKGFPEFPNRLRVMVSAATARGDSLAAGGASPAAALTGGSQLALELAAGFVVLAIVVAITVIPSGSATRSEKRADEEAPEFDAIADAA